MYSITLYSYKNTNMDPRKEYNPLWFLSIRVLVNHDKAKRLKPKLQTLTQNFNSNPLTLTLGLKNNKAHKRKAMGSFQHARNDY